MAIFRRCGEGNSTEWNDMPSLKNTSSRRDMVHIILGDRRWNILNGAEECSGKGRPTLKPPSCSVRTIDLAQIWMPILRGHEMSPQFQLDAMLVSDAKRFNVAF